MDWRNIIPNRINEKYGPNSQVRVDWRNIIPNRINEKYGPNLQVCVSWRDILIMPTGIEAGLNRRRMWIGGVEEIETRHTVSGRNS